MVQKFEREIAFTSSRASIPHKTVIGFGDLIGLDRIYLFRLQSDYVDSGYLGSQIWISIYGSDYSGRIRTKSSLLTGLEQTMRSQIHL